jgi:hypothetical protein
MNDELIVMRSLMKANMSFLNDIPENPAFCIRL